MARKYYNHINLFGLIVDMLGISIIWPNRIWLIEIFTEDKEVLEMAAYHSWIMLAVVALDFIQGV